MSTEHTKTPWRQNGGTITAQAGMAILVATCAGDKRTAGAVPEAERLANAEFIVRACNSHEMLASALHEAVGHMQHLLQFVPAGCKVCIGPEYVQGVERCITESRAALKLATESGS